jgi:hypothetical protein
MNKTTLIPKIAVIGGLVLMLSLGCTSKGEYVIERDSPWRITAGGYTMSKEEFQGHTYIVVTRGGLLHDPDCKCKTTKN